MNAIKKNEEKPHRFIEKRNVKTKLSVHIAIPFSNKVKCLGDFHKNYVSMWLKNKKMKYTHRVIGSIFL